MDNLTAAEVGDTPAAPPDYSSLDRYPKGVEPYLQVMTMGELQMRLPHGNRMPDGKRVRSLGFRDLGLSGQLDIAQFKDDKAGARHTDLVNETLRIGASDFGGVDLTSMDAKLTPTYLSQFYAGDVFYGYAAQRRYVLGSPIKQPSQCPNCRLKWTPTFQLDDIDVLVPVNPPKDYHWFLPLQDGITVERAGVTYKVMGLWLQPASWGHVMNAQGVTLKQRLANTKRFQIVGAETADGEPVLMGGVFLLSEGEMLRKPEAGGFSTYDAGQLDESLVYNSPGIQMVLSTTCPPELKGCRFDYEEALDWRHDVFFTFSRRSRRPGRS